MKKLLILFMSCSLLFMGCRHDDVLETETVQNEQNHLKGKSFLLTQSELEAKYAGNKSLNTILQNEFKREGSLMQTNSETEENGIYIDLDHIQVLESDNMHTITYYVAIGAQESEDSKEIYNLMYFSKDYENYYVILFRYNFNQISLQQYITNPKQILNILSFIPLNDIENIYENIGYSISQRQITTSSSSTTFSTTQKELIDLADCIDMIVISEQRCGGKDQHHYYESCPHRGTSLGPVAPRTIFDFSRCGKSGGGPGGNPGSGGGSVGNPGGSFPGGGGGGRWSSPIKSPGDLIRISDLTLDPNFGFFNTNLKTLKAISNSIVIKADLTDFDSKLKQVREFGAAYSFKTVNGSYTYDNKLTLAIPSGVNTKIDVSTASTAYAGVIHSHPEHLGSLSNHGAPLFSIGDLAAVFKFANVTPVSLNRKPSEAFVGVVNKYGLYMVMLPNDVTQANMGTKYADFTKTTAIGNKIVGDTKKSKWIDMEKELTKKYQDIESSGDPEHFKKAAHEKALLETMKKYGLELNIYFLPRTSGTFNDTWQQLTLNTNGQVQYTNIN